MVQNQNTNINKTRKKAKGDGVADGDAAQTLMNAPQTSCGLMAGRFLHNLSMFLMRIPSFGASPTR